MPTPDRSSSLPGYKAQDPKQALERYTRYLAATRPGDPSRAEAWKQTVDSALQLGRYDLAEKNLRDWQFESKTAVTSWDWNQSHAHFLWATKGRNAYTSTLADLVERKDLDWTTREAAGRELADHFWKVREYGLSFDALGLLYRAAPDNTARGPLESHALSRAESLSLAELQKIQDGSLGADPTAYPWSMVIWAQGMKLLNQDENNWASVQPSLAGIVGSGDLVNRDFFAGNLRALEQKLGVVQHSLVLLLPLSGPYSQVGWQIAKGADCAWRENKAAGNAPQIKLINTESPTFLDELSAVVRDVPFVGGPLRKEIWQKIRMAGLHRSARFLTFLPNVEDEGQEAWRFFTDPADQVRALIRGCVELGITSFAVLYPQDRFGMAMLAVFQEEARVAGVQVPVTRGYDKENPPTWSKAVAEILGTTDKAENTLNPEPPYQAVFLPDSLFRVQQLAPLFHYYEEKRLVFLGPQVWTQGMTGDNLEMQYFQLALFPGAWDAGLTSGNTEKLRRGMAQSGGTIDMWAALGYDFVHFTALLGSGQGSAEDFNLALSRAAHRMPWAQAPMDWINGRAVQELFLFQPTESGMIRANPDTINALRRQAQEEREERRLELHGTP